jgi:hypothetical protein
VLGERWRSIPQLLRDLGIGVAFLFVSVLVLSIVGPIVGMKRDNSEVQFLLPQANREKLLWLIVALSAGVCEEAVYRGYLQRQFTALTKSIPVGILFSAMAFAMAHLYQGLPRASVILLGAVMSGALAHWRKTVRPGMFAHVLQDLLPLVIRH